MLQLRRQRRMTGIHYFIPSYLLVIYNSFHPPLKEDIEKFGWRFNSESFGTNGMSDPVHFSSKFTPFRSN